MAAGALGDQVGRLPAGEERERVPLQAGQGLPAGASRFAAAADPQEGFPRGQAPPTRLLQEMTHPPPADVLGALESDPVARLDDGVRRGVTTDLNRSQRLGHDCFPTPWPHWPPCFGMTAPKPAA